MKRIDHEPMGTESQIIEADVYDREAEIGFVREIDDGNNDQGAR